jgi:hypothetical protein
VEWIQVTAPVVAAAAAIGGVTFGARLTESRESLAWSREQRLKAYADLLEALDRCYSAFALISSTLNLADYAPDRSLIDVGVKPHLEDWGRWDQRLDEVLPRAELVSSASLQPFLTVGVRYGMRSRHRVLLMVLTHSLTADRSEWKSVAKMTLDDLDSIRARLRGDLELHERKGRLLNRIVRGVRRSARVRRAAARST